LGQFLPPKKNRFLSWKELNLQVELIEGTVFFYKNENAHLEMKL